MDFLVFQPEMKNCCFILMIDFLQIESKGRVCGSERMLFVFPLTVGLKKLSAKEDLMNLLGGAVVDVI